MLTEDEKVIRQSVGLGYAVTALITCLVRLYKGCVVLMLQF